MKLKPSIGFDNVKFGMTKEEILYILGKPDKIRFDEDSEILEFNNLKSRLRFQLEGKQLFTYFSTINNLLQYESKLIVGLEINEVKKSVFAKLISEWELEYYDLFETHFNEKYWITLNSEFGIVSTFEMGVPFKNGNEYQWPT